MFATGQIEYLGHTLTMDGVKPNENNVTAVSDILDQNQLSWLEVSLGWPTSTGDIFQVWLPYRGL